MLDINGASALVTGGASGLGEATVKALAAKGAKVVILDLGHQADKGKALADEVGGAFAETDVTDADQVIAAIEVAKALGPLKALVTRPASAGPPAPSARTANTRRRTTSTSSARSSTSTSPVRSTARGSPRPP